MGSMTEREFLEAAAAERDAFGDGLGPWHAAPAGACECGLARPAPVPAVIENPFGDL